VDTKNKCKVEGCKRINYAKGFEKGWKIKGYLK